MKLNLKAVCVEEEKILKYLEENVSEELAEKINKKPERPMVAMLNYVYKEAEELYRKNSNQNNCIMIDDPVVYGWAIHYYEDVESEEDIAKANKVLEQLNSIDEEETKPTSKSTPKPKSSKPKNEKPTKEKLLKAYQQLSLLDELGL